MNEIRFNVNGYDVTENNEVKNQITNFVINEVETNKKNCRFSCVLSLDDDDWKVISYITKNKGEKNYHLVFGVYKHDGTTMNFGVDLDFGTLSGWNVNKLIGKVVGVFFKVIEQMFDECGVMTTDEKYFAEVKETIEEMVENETPHQRYTYSTYGSEFLYLFPNGINESTDVMSMVSRKISEYYKECMKAKLCRLYNADGKMNDFEIDRLYYNYMNMLSAKWKFMLEFGEIKTEVKMVNEEIENAVKNDAPLLDSVEEIVESALESAMDDDVEYYDDRICQIGELYVSYTSPCDEFPNGCVCVVDEDGRMYGNWCNVSDSGFAVDFLVDALEKYNKEIEVK